MAEDVAQETWVAALTHAHPERVRQWLGRVVRNLARNLLRAERRRAGRERAASSSEAVPSAERVVQRLETSRCVIDAVMAKVSRLLTPWGVGFRQSRPGSAYLVDTG
ncbi:MAG: sigma factor [Planctomycetota bacterium]